MPTNYYQQRLQNQANQRTYLESQPQTNYGGSASTSTTTRTAQYGQAQRQAYAQQQAAAQARAQAMAAQRQAAEKAAYFERQDQIARQQAQRQAQQSQQREGYPGVPRLNYREEYPGLEGMRGPVGIGVSNVVQDALSVGEEYYQDAAQYGGPGGMLPGIPQAQPPVSYLPTMNTLNYLSDGPNRSLSGDTYGGFQDPEWRKEHPGYQMYREQYPTTRDYDYNFYENDRTDLPNYQWEREQYKDGDFSWGEVGVQAPYDGGGGGWSLPSYGGYGNYPSYVPGEQVKSWYENMLQWKI